MASKPRRKPVSFGEDFRRFFLRGVEALLPTLITLWLVVWAWNFLWESLGRHIIWGLKRFWYGLATGGIVLDQPAGYIGRYWDDEYFRTRFVGVILAIVAVYIVGVFVGNLIGRTAWRVAENGVMRIPLIRAVYPAVKQITDFLLSDRTGQFAGSRVVAVQPHEDNIWSVGLVTGAGIQSLADSVGEEMVTVFVPSTPTAFTGYVLVVPRNRIVELPLTVEEAMRLLVSGGVITPEKDTKITSRSPAVLEAPPEDASLAARAEHRPAV